MDEVRYDPNTMPPKWLLIGSIIGLILLTLFPVAWVAQLIYWIIVLAVLLPGLLALFAWRWTVRCISAWISGHRYTD